MAVFYAPVPFCRLRNAPTAGMIPAYCEGTKSARPAGKSKDAKETDIMADFVLSCCSTADLTKEHFQQRDISYICFHYALDGVD